VMFGLRLMGACKFFRREHLGPVLSRQSTDASKRALAAELALTKKALAVNPKSYATWHHRRWTVVTGGANLENELVLVYK
jgi:geranylgeranyl transferase type-2 subunit alpha